MCPFHASCPTHRPQQQILLALNSVLLVSPCAPLSSDGWWWVERWMHSLYPLSEVCISSVIQGSIWMSTSFTELSLSLSVARRFSPFTYGQVLLCLVIAHHCASVRVWLWGALQVRTPFWCFLFFTNIAMPLFYDMFFMSIISVHLLNNSKGT